MPVAALGLLAVAAPLFAHHSFAAEYDNAKPIALTGTVTKVEGGWESRVLAELTKDGGHLAEIGLGFNPKAASYGGRATGMAGPSRSGALHIATGGNGGEHMDGCLFRATVTIDGRPMIENGHIVALDRPDVRALAEKYRTRHEGSWLWTATEHRELQHYR